MYFKFMTPPQLQCETEIFSFNHYIFIIKEYVMQIGPKFNYHFNKFLSNESYLPQIYNKDYIQ